MEERSCAHAAATAPSLSLAIKATRVFIRQMGWMRNRRTGGFYSSTQANDGVRGIQKAARYHNAERPLKKEKEEG